MKDLTLTEATASAPDDVRDTGLPPDRLLRSLWTSTDCVYQIAARDPRTGRFEHFSYGLVGGAINKGLHLSARGHDVYIACAEFKDPHNRKADNALGARGFWIDIDCSASKAATGDGYADVAQARGALRDFLELTGLPEPTHIVESGGGLHTYWAGDRRLERSVWQPAAKELDELTVACGFLADSSRTADIASLLRMPGTLNFKYDPPSVSSRY